MASTAASINCACVKNASFFRRCTDSDFTHANSGIEAISGLAVSFSGLSTGREQRGRRGLAFQKGFFKVFGECFWLVQRAERIGEAEFGLFM